ncbi:MAG TPA: sulfotransferase, partial [Stellaceae bacterium]|nr:sulfotransferase [Stellaceae bacterium]
AVALAPANADLHSNRAAVLAALGRHDEALAAVHSAVGLRPGLVSAHLHGAVIEMERDRLDAALRWIDAIPSEAAETVEVLLVRADILGRLDRADEAVELCRRAVALRPEDGSAHNLLGVELQACGRDEEALGSFARAGRLPGRPGIALANQSALLSQLGRAEEAREVVAHALARDPECAAAWYARATAQRYRPGDPDFAAMEAILAADRVPAHAERMYLHYALGGAYLDAGDGVKAFAHLGAGARMKRALLTYDGAANERWMDEIAAAFPASLVAAHRRANDSDMPVFVIGMPRSGTTLIEQILGAHPKVFAAGETRHLEASVARAIGSTDPQAFPAAFSPTMADAIGRDYLGSLTALAPGATRIVDKMMSNIVYAGLIHMMLPRARIILSRRDAVDTCLSCYSKLFSRGQAFSYDLAELGQYFRAQEKLAAHWRSVLPPDIFLEVQYESVVADLEHEARRLVAFCGLEWSPACLAFHEARRPVRTASMTQVRQPIYQTSVGRWRPFRVELAPLLKALQGAD